jgi:fucose 4-O-acetylase-like acetyltransferase
MQNITKNNINYTFKMLYIIAIFMVVDGHIGRYDYLSLNGLLRYQNYHLALFMFASGYFLNLTKEPLEYVKSKLYRLILPLYLWNLIYGLIAHILNNYYNVSLGSPINLYNLLIAPLTDGHQFIYNMASWFLVPLFCLQILSFFILKPFERSKYLKQISLIFFIISILIYCLVVPIAPQNNAQRNFSLLFFRTIYFFPSFAFGFLYKKILEKHDTLSSPIYFFTILLAYTTISILYPNHTHTPSWLNDFYAPPFATLLITIIAILFWLRIAKILAPLVKKSKTLTTISNNTFAIMMHHFIGFMIIKATISPFFKDFDHHQFHNNIWYNYFPYSESLTSWIYIFITIVISLLISFTTKQFYDTIKRNIKHLL